jgi:hypothetical protein
LRVAEIEAVWSEGMEAAAVTGKGTVVAPAGTVTEEGTGSSVLLLARATVVPPVGAVLLTVMVQEAATEGLSEVGEQTSEETRMGATRLMEADLDWPLTVAEIEAVWSEGMDAAAVAVKDAVMAPAGTVTEEGTVSSVLLLARATAVPPAGAVPLTVIVQVAAADFCRLAGAHVKLVRPGVRAAGPVTTPPAPDIAR